MNNQLKAVYIIFCIVIGFVAWSLSYGAILGLVFKDGRIFRLTITTQPLAPFIQLWHYGSNVTLQKVAAAALVPALVSSIILSLIGLRRRTEPLGEARFQTVAELRDGRWFRNKGHIFARIGKKRLQANDARHHVVIGPTRSGKGVGYVIPNALLHEGSMLVTDLKGEIFSSTAAFRRKNGNQVFLFAPGQEETHCWNPLDFIRPDRGSRVTDIQNMATILVPKTSNGDGAFWQQMSQRIAAGLISYINESQFYEGRRNLSEINSLLNCGIPVQVLLKYILEKEPGLSLFTRESFNAYINLAEKTASSALTELQNALTPFQNERIAAATKSTNIDIAAMNRVPMSIYLAPNVTDITLLRPLLTLFVQQVMNLLMLQHDPRAVPVYFLLDEFRQLKKMDEVMNKLPYVAGYNIKLSFILQDLKNLDETYGETARYSLLGNCGYQLVLAANDQATAEYVTKALGKTTARYESVSRSIEPFGLHKRTKVEQIRERDLMMAQEVRTMPEDDCILLVESQKPIYANKVKFYEDPALKQAVKFSEANRPFVPEARIVDPLPVPALTDEYEKAGETIQAPWKKHADTPSNENAEAKAIEETGSDSESHNAKGKAKPARLPPLKKSEVGAKVEPERANPKSAEEMAKPKPPLREVITEDGEIIEVEVEDEDEDELGENNPLPFKLLTAKKNAQLRLDLAIEKVDEEVRKNNKPERIEALKNVKKAVLAET